MASPTLNLEHFKYVGLAMLTCNRCQGYTRQEQYEGDAFNPHKTLRYCIECGFKSNWCAL